MSNVASDRFDWVPACETDVTATWLKKALSNAFPDERFETIDLQRIGTDFGLASEIFRCRFSAIQTAESVLIKLWPTNTPAGTNEVFFYRMFGDDTGTRIPACFHSGIDTDRQRGALVLEDITAAIQGDCLQQLTLNQAKAVARNLAGLHSTWLEHHVLHEAEWLRPISRWEPDAAWFAARRALFLERFANRLDGFARSILDRIEHAPRIANERLECAAVTLLHADLHLDNLLFERGTQPVILDWARCAKGPAALDLADLLFGMCELEDIETVLTTYIDAFRERSERISDTATVRSQLGGALLRCFTSSTCGIARWQPASRREEAMIDAAIARALQAVRHWSKQDPDLFSFLQ